MRIVKSNYQNFKMSAVTERVTESNVKIQHKLKTSSKPGLGVQKGSVAVNLWNFKFPIYIENFGLHHSKRVNDAPSTCTPARKPLGNVSNTIRKSSVPQKTNIVKKKPTTDMMMMLDECPDMEYMPKTSESGEFFIHLGLIYMTTVSLKTHHLGLSLTQRQLKRDM